MTFAEKVLQYVKPESRVLDLGAGNGEFAQECLTHEAIVTAVDLQEPLSRLQGVDWQRADVRDYLERLKPEVQFDIIFSRNLIQFIDSRWVIERFFPIIVDHVRPNGIVAIQTFFRDPEPPFDRPVISLFSVEQLQNAIAPLKVLYSKAFSRKGPDMRGVTRMFYVSNIIAKKVDNSS